MTILGIQSTPRGSNDKDMNNCWMNQQYKLLRGIFVRVTYVSTDVTVMTMAMIIMII